MSPDNDDPTSYEVDRHVDEQPPREDLIDPEDIEIGEGDDPDDLEPDGLDEEAELGDPELLPSTEDLPESQGEDMVTADRLAEDAASRPALGDEELVDDEEE